jgi:MoaA/NifB/PqqE/SkfB family radical SAM enzyme
MTIFDTDKEKRQTSMTDKDNYRPLLHTDYKPLNTLIPLNAPLRFGCALTTRCNFKCAFCYHANNQYTPRKVRDMPLDLVEKIANDFYEFDEIVPVADISQNGEPLLYPHLEEAITMLKNTGKMKVVRIITNGSLLFPEKAESLLNSGLDELIISINGLDDEQYRSIVNANIKFDDIYNNVKYFYSIRGNCHIHVKMIGNYFSDDDQKRFLDTFSPISDSIFIDKAVNQWIGLQIPSPPYGRDEGVNRFNRCYKVDEDSLQVCSAPFYFLRIHPSGITSCCLGDWAAGMSLGNVNDMSLKDIWTGVLFQDLRKAQLTRNNIPEQCKQCHYYELTTSEDITPYRDALIKKCGFD